MATSAAREALQRHVDEEGLTAVAAKIGMSPSGVLYLASGERGASITVNIAAAIEAAYGIPMVEWLPWIEAA